ncbi:hypothetical protein B0I35DRAFT_465159 [Stachybotrys elegans]|uniref:F-box domain-containing protein n=1 Tax=Stachybotrys elegans TaxID=80388 RepID=A0A8K0SEX4_9HYPO|nr:hypothetical protein B0I35DRAFT_465159 [Stachybotrys elegans]
MHSTGSSSGSTPQKIWPFPFHITSQILEGTCFHKTQTHCPHLRDPLFHCDDLAKYAAVCLEWQDIVERRTFRELDLDRDRLADAATIMCARRQSYVRRIFMHTNGPESHGGQEEDHQRNSLKFTETIVSFFNVLSKWTCSAGEGNNMVSLDIKALLPLVSNPDIYHRYADSILQLLSTTNLPSVNLVSHLRYKPGREMSAQAWASIINGLPNAKHITISIWDNEKKDMDLRRSIRDEIGDALLRTQCPCASVNLVLNYKEPKDHACNPPKLIDMPGIDDNFTRVLSQTAIKRVGQCLPTLELGIINKA